MKTLFKKSLFVLMVAFIAVLTLGLSSKVKAADESVATAKDLVNHINYIRDLIGIDYVGLGSDFDGISNKNIEIKNASMMNLLIEELRNQGYTEDEIDKICFKNVLRVFKENF